jgi:hypothetical protein
MLVFNCLQRCCVLKVAVLCARIFHRKIKVCKNATAFGKALI